MPTVLGMTPQCAEIRRLMLAIPAFWKNGGDDCAGIVDPDEPIEDGTARQHANFRRVMSMRDKLDRLVQGLGRKKAHTMPELATLVLALAWGHGFYSSTVQAFPETVINALLRTLCGVAPEAAPEWA